MYSSKTLTMIARTVGLKIALAVLVLKTQENTLATALKTLVKEGLQVSLKGWVGGGRGDCGFYCLKKKKKNKLSGWTKINKWVQQGISWFTLLQLVQLVHLVYFFKKLIFNFDSFCFIFHLETS